MFIYPICVWFISNKDYYYYILTGTHVKYHVSIITGTRVKYHLIYNVTAVTNKHMNYVTILNFILRFLLKKDDLIFHV